MSFEDPNDHRLDHVVVLMFENHSFDSLLGFLYRPGEAPQFEGVWGRELSNAVPPAVADTGPAQVSVHPATSMAAPYPDPGEEYPHVNTQIYGTINPETNRYAKVGDILTPFNSPAPPIPAPPPMNGFVLDYVNTFKVTMDRLPNPTEYSQIMACYTPEQVPVLSGLARGFACFDHWFCEVPSQTYPNRSFFHAATSSGFVLNGHPPGKFATLNDARTVFNLLEDAHRTWRVYIDPAQILSATGLIHARQLGPFFADHFRTIFDFYEDSKNGELPAYSFIEPNMFHPHTDFHPHSGARWAEELGLAPPDTIMGGEQLLAGVYDSIRTSSSAGGSNFENTALLVTFDEHGGTFDHVPPPAALPPDSSQPEENFGFDRLGLRVPTVLISAWAEEGRVVTEGFRHTSLIRTLRDWWNLGPPLSRRDGDAPSLLPMLSRQSPRQPETWPTIEPRTPGILRRAEERFLSMVESLDSPMERIERDMLADGLAREAFINHADVRADTLNVSHREAHEHFRRIGPMLFPNVAVGKRS